MDDEEVLSWVGEEAGRIASICEHHPASTPVPSCPGWTLGDLLEHVAPLLGGWYTYNLTPRPGDFDLAAAFASGYPLPEGYGARVEHLRRSIATFRDAARDADLAAPVRAFGACVEARSWLPRAGTEFAVHRWDAEGAGPGPTPLGPGRAAESLDETLRVFWPAITAFQWPPGLGRGAAFAVPSEPVGIRALDSGRSWRLFPDSTDGGRMGCAETTDQPGTDLPETVLEGPGDDLVLHLWGRQDGGGLRVHGSAELIRCWNVVAHFGI